MRADTETCMRGIHMVYSAMLAHIPPLIGGVGPLVNTIKSFGTSTLHRYYCILQLLPPRCLLSVLSSRLCSVCLPTIVLTRSLAHWHTVTRTLTYLDAHRIRYDCGWSP
jgi:hypothetical protein